MPTTYHLAALVADSLSLGSHWIYNQSKITRTFPEGITELTAPLANYHAGKKAGDFTHYGDQTIWLSQAIAESNNYDHDTWKSQWLTNMSGYSGYKDSATNDSYANQANQPSTSNDLAGASRIAPLLDLNSPLEQTVANARAQTQLTHGDINVIESAEFFVRAIYAVRDGASFADAFQTAAQTGQYTSLNPTAHLAVATQADPTEHLKVAAAMGLTCHFPEAFPLTLYYAIHHGQSFAQCISQNALAGGDNSARAMLLALLFVARGHAADIATIENLSSKLNLTDQPSTTSEPMTFTPGSHSLSIDGPNGTLAGIIEIPDGEIKICAIFAHCFTCGKDYLPEKKITQALAKNGIATLRVDFSGLGKSSGKFEDSSFLTNVEDIYAAADWLKANLLSPHLLVGHSLGGTAVLAAAGNIPEVQAVATIGSPADPAHILHMLEDHLDEISQQGQANVKLAGRDFTVSQKFVDDVRSYDHIATLNALTGHKLIMHSPTDETVELKNAGEIYSQLKHPKSFIALDGANHLLTANIDAEFAANMIATWAQKVTS